MNIACKEGTWMELAHDRVKWRVLVLVASNLRVMAPEN